MIDHHGGKTLINEIALVKNSLSVKCFLNELLTHIQTSGMSPRTKKALCNRIWTFRQNSITACKESFNKPDHQLKDILLEKEKTGGDLFRVWAELLEQVYPVKSSETAKSAGQIIGNVAMAIQVLDDMLDLPVDYPENVSNIFYELLKENPGELEIAVRHIGQIYWKHLDWKWAKDNLPVTCMNAAKLVKQYLECAIRASLKSEMTGELCRIVTVWSQNALGKIDAS